MPQWHNHSDQFFNRKSQDMAGAIETYIYDASAYIGGDLEQMKAEIAAQMRVLKALAKTLTPVQEAIVAQELGFKPGSDAD